jgi:hypothetical protein
MLDKLIQAKAADIRKIIESYNIPLLDLPKAPQKKADDD